MVTYQVELLSDVIEEMVPLLEAHYKEVHAFPDKIPFNPDYDSYFKLEEMGIYHTVTVREDGELIGYCCALVSRNLHYQDHLYAVNDVIYVDKEYRHSNVAEELIAFVEECYKELGASVMTFHMKCSIPFESLCKSRGMEKKEYLYMKFIGD